MRSFRLQLALRFTAAMALALAAVMTLGWLALRATLDRQIDASILNVASIQASSVAGDPSGEMHFHEWDLTPEEAASVRNLNRWTQIWSESGQSLLRTQYLTRDLPLDSAALRRAAAGELAWTEQSFREMEIRSLYYPLGRLRESTPVTSSRSPPPSGPGTRPSRPRASDWASSGSWSRWGPSAAAGSWRAAPWSRCATSPGRRR